MARTTSVPGRTGRKRSARSAAGVRRGSTTTTLAPSRARASMRGAQVGVGHRRVGAPDHDEVAVGDVGRDRRWPWSRSTSRHALPGGRRADGVLHLGRSERLEQQGGQPVALQHGGRRVVEVGHDGRPGRARRWRRGSGRRRGRGPRPSRSARTRPRPSARSDAAASSAARSPWMRRVMRRTLRQIQPSVSGLAASPSGTASMAVIRSSSTVTDERAAVGAVERAGRGDGGHGRRLDRAP